MARKVALWDFYKATLRKMLPSVVLMFHSLCRTKNNRHPKVAQQQLDRNLETNLAALPIPVLGFGEFLSDSPEIPDIRRARPPFRPKERRNLTLSSPAVHSKDAPGNQQCRRTLQLTTSCAGVQRGKSPPTYFNSFQAYLNCPPSLLSAHYFRPFKKIK